MKKLFVAVCALFLGACAADPTVRSGPATRAIEWNERGQAEFARGNDAAALANFQKALAINRAVENADGVALELLNIAAVHFRRGERDAAFAAVTEVIEDQTLGFSVARRADAAFRRARFLYDSGERDAAAQDIARVLSWCADGCAVSGPALNLRARLALDSGDVTQAIAAARRAERINRGQGDAIERANSLRVLGEAALAAGDYASARSAYESALALDKENGAARKIALDLIGLARAHHGIGRPRDAVQLAQRARTVAISVDDAALHEAADAEIARAAPGQWEEAL